MGETGTQSFFEGTTRRRYREGRSTKYRSVLLWVVALALASFRPACASDIAWSAMRKEGAIVLHGSASLDADVSAAWRVLTGYERYAEFMPGVQRSVVQRDGASVTVEQTLSVPLCLFRVPVEITWRIAESPPDALHSHATSDQMSIDSRYALTPLGDGVRIDYTGRIMAPRALRSLDCGSGERMMAAEFHALVTEIERQHRSATSMR